MATTVLLLNVKPTCLPEILMALCVGPNTMPRMALCELHIEAV